MRAIIPVAGRGKRLRPHTHTQPKVLMTVAGKPILAHILDDLRDLPLDEVTFVVGHLAEKVEEFVREHYPYRVDFVHQEEPLGNGHAIYVARDKLDGPTLIVFGDTIVQADLTHALRLPHSSIGVHRVPDPRAFGVVEVDRDGFVRRLVEEGRPVNGEYWLADALQLMVDEGEPLQTFPVARWYDCGTPESLLQANHALLEEVPAPDPIHGSVVIPPSSIAPTAVIEGSVIGPYVTVADGARVAHAVIRESIINAHARVESVLLEHSIIGENATVTGRRARINLGDSSEVELS